MGNVTPWIVIPGPYTDRELTFQAENVAAMITNNASFNCIATKMIVTSRAAPQRQQFLDKIEAVLSRIPRRRAYYPGAERFTRFTGRPPEAGAPGTLPWTLVRDAQPDRDPQFFEEESFVCVCAETALDVRSDEEFVENVANFVNDRLWGNLGAGIMVHPKFRRQPGNEDRFQDLVGRLRFGTIGINHWPAISYALDVYTLGWLSRRDARGPQERAGLGTQYVPARRGAEDRDRRAADDDAEAVLVPHAQDGQHSGRKSVDLTSRPSVWKLPGLMLPACAGKTYHARAQS